MLVYTNKSFSGVCVHVLPPIKVILHQYEVYALHRRHQEALHAEAGEAERNRSRDAEEEADRWRLTGALS